MKIIQLKASPLVKPVRLIVFTKNTDCKACQQVTELARAVKSHLGTLALDIFDIVMDRDQTELFGIQRVPALVVQGAEGRSVTFYGFTENMLLEVFMNTIQAVSRSQEWFSEDIRRSLQRLDGKVMIRVFASDDCSVCKMVAEMAIGLALESDRIHTAVIKACYFPELVQKYNITVLPLTIFGEDINVTGSISDVEFIEHVFQAQGITPEPDRRCLVCGKPSTDIICSNCKAKIQAEALNHKLKQEKQEQSEIP